MVQFAQHSPLPQKSTKNRSTELSRSSAQICARWSFQLHRYEKGHKALKLIIKLFHLTQGMKKGEQFSLVNRYIEKLTENKANLDDLQVLSNSNHSMTEIAGLCVTLVPKSLH